MKLKKIVVLITVFALSCQTLAGCGTKEVGVVPEQMTENENSAAEVADENVASDTDTTVTKLPNEGSTEGEESEENLEAIEDENPSSADTEIENTTPETENQEENPSDNENSSNTGKEDTKKPNKEDNKKPNKKDDKKPGKEEGKKPNKDESDRTDKEEGSQSESSSPEDENAKNNKIRAVLTADFAANVNGAGSSEELAGSIAANEKLSGFSLVVMPVKEGYLNGFDNEIRGFDEAAMFSPMIGSIPFVAYIFKTSDADALVSTLKSNANLRWNICTSADEMTVKVSGDYVLFAMTPSTFDE